MEEQPEDNFPKQYSPPNPTIKDCIELYELLPINKIDKNIESISSIIYEKEDFLNEFLQKVDDRLTISKEDSEEDFIKCEYNRDSDSYRSPHSNKYFPPLSNCKYPSNDLRELEKLLNASFKTYTHLYYSNLANSSVYCWNAGNSIEDGFCCAVLIKNTIQTSEREGVWNSNNVVTVAFKEKSGQIYADYKLISTVMLQMGFENKYNGKADLSGSLTKKIDSSKLCPKGYLDYEAHVENIGSMIEDIETQIRNSIENIYIMKSKEIIGTARYSPNANKPNVAQMDELRKVFMNRPSN